MEQLLRFIMLAISLYGYIQFFSKNIRAEFALGVTFASIGCVMFFAGILNVLPLAAYIITASGIVLAVTSVKDLKNSIIRIITPGTVFFAIISVALAVIIKGSYYGGGDAFHHWGTVIKVLIDYNRFPTPENFNINFPSYPTGSASFIYYFAKICHANSEWFVILVQALLTLSMFISVFAFAKDKISCLICAIAVIVFLCSNESFYFLGIDNLITAVAVCGLAIAIYHKDNLCGYLKYIAPFVIYLTALKNSGLLFSVVLILYCIIYTPKNKNNFIPLITFTASPFVTLLLWQKHVDLLFPKGMSESLHAMSLTHYAAMYKEKIELNLLNQTWDMYSQHVLSPNNVVLYIFVIIILYIIYSIVTNHKADRNFIELSLFLTLVYIAYQLGLLGAYIFSMPSYEMENPNYLPSYERYHATILIFMAAIICIAIMHYLPKFSSDKSAFRFSTPLLLAIALIFSTMACKPDFSYYKPQKEEDISVFVQYRRLLDEYAVPNRCKYLVIGNETASLKYFSYYYLDALDCRAWDIETLEKYERYLNNFDYLILEDNSAETMASISQMLDCEITERVVYLPDYMDQIPVTD